MAHDCQGGIPAVVFGATGASENDQAPRYVKGMFAVSPVRFLSGGGSQYSWKRLKRQAWLQACRCSTKGHRANYRWPLVLWRAGDGARTRDPQLGRLML